MDLNSCLCEVEFPWAALPLDSPVEPEAIGQFQSWLAAGRNGDMAYMANYPDLRTDPRTLLEGARSLIVVAFPYYTDEPFNLPVSLYARGRDYHEVVRERLKAIAGNLPGDYRICVDTAPLRERYWAQRAGLGFIGRNNQLIIPGLGSYFFLGFIISTFEIKEACKGNLPASEGHLNGCAQCRRCIDACPGQCLSPDGRGLDARSCLSYLTIEYRGELTRRIPTVYGCDVCQRVCPHNADPHPTPIADFHPSAEFASLTAERLQSMTREEFSALFRHSAIKRTKLTGLQRNLAAFNLGRASGEASCGSL